MKETTDCPICGTRNARTSSSADYIEYDCPMCGHYHIARAALELAGEEDQVVLFDALQTAKRTSAPDELPLISNLSG